jgi:hypothetical protein
LSSILSLNFSLFHSRKLEDTFQTPDFAAAFPCEIDLATLRATMAH